MLEGLEDCSAGKQEQGPECEPTTSRERDERRKALTLSKCSSKEQKYQNLSMLMRLLIFFRYDFMFLSFL